MPAVQNRSDQPSGAPARPAPVAIPAQRSRAPHDQVTDPVAADDRWVEMLRAGRGEDADDPLVRALARWRAPLVEGT